MKRLVPLVVMVTGLILSSCGSDEKSSASSSTTVAPVTTPGPGVSYTGDRDSRFCQVGADFSQRFGSLGTALQGSAESLKTEVAALKEVVDEAKAAAPDAVKSDVETLGRAFSQFFSQLEATNYDPKAAAAGAAKLGTSEVQLAVQHLQAYGAQVCGLAAP